MNFIGQFICNFATLIADLVYKCDTVMCAICQNTMSSGVCCTTNNVDWLERADETHSHTKPVVVPETTNMTQ